MFFIVSKILKVFILPMTWIVGLLVLSCLVKNKRWHKGLFIAAMAVLLVFSDKPLLQWAQYMTTRSYSHQKLPKQYYEVAVVMGGYSNGIDTATRQLAYIDDRGARLWEAIRLYQSGVAEKILITGDASFNDNKSGQADTFRQFMHDFGIHGGDLMLETKARNTRENALYSIALLDSLHIKSEECLLVTSATHTKRSLASFAAEGWQLDAYAVNVYPKPHPTASQFIPQWRTLTDWQEMLNEWVGGVVYKVVGARTGTPTESERG